MRFNEVELSSEIANFKYIFSPIPKTISSKNILYNLLNTFLRHLSFLYLT